MSKTSHSYIKKANSLFSQNKYEEAEQFYIKAGKKLGMSIVEASIWLCQKRRDDESSLQQYTLESSTVAENSEALEQQLYRTQLLLEEYYRESQNLKLKLMQRNET